MVNIKGNSYFKTLLKTCYNPIDVAQAREDGVKWSLDLMKKNPTHTEFLLIKGKEYSVKIEKSSIKTYHIDHSSRIFTVKIPHTHLLDSHILWEFFSDWAKKYVLNRMKELALEWEIYNSVPGIVELKSNKTKRVGGVCKTFFKTVNTPHNLQKIPYKTIISLSLLCAAHSPPVLDYIIAHEMAHALNPNEGHTKPFWETLESLCPLYLRYELQQWKENLAINTFNSRKESFRDRATIGNKTSASLYEGREGLKSLHTPFPKIYNKVYFLPQGNEISVTFAKETPLKTNIHSQFIIPFNKFTNHREELLWLAHRGYVEFIQREYGEISFEWV